MRAYHEHNDYALSFLLCLISNPAYRVTIVAPHWAWGMESQGLWLTNNNPAPTNNKRDYEPGDGRKPPFVRGT